MKKVTIPARTEASIGTAFVRKMKALSPGCLVVKLKGDGRRDLPDYMVLGVGGKVVFIEMKRPGQVPTARQFKMLEDLRARGFAATWATAPDMAWERTMNGML